MFEELMKEVIDERTKLFDRCTKELFKIAGINCPENPSNFETIMLLDELQHKRYKIKLHKSNKPFGGYTDRILLIKVEDLVEETIAGFDIELKVENMSVSIVANPISFVKELK